MTTRALLLVAAGCAVAAAALWHQSVQAPRGPSTQAPPDENRSSVVDAARPPTPPAPLSESEALREIERLHRLQADLAQARAARKDERVEGLLHKALTKLDALVDRPGLARRPQFRRVFHSLTAAYEARYDVPDTLRLPSNAVRERQDALGAALDADSLPALNTVLPSALQTQSSPVPLTVNASVRETMAFLLDRRQKYLRPWLRRASTYFPMIEQIFADEDVPDVLKYLALAESGLNPHARSRARAAGIWQFIAQTGRQYGLSIDPWVDERLDPEKATRAAARHLKDLYAQFGDWELALAGYNCNPGVVQYHVEQYRERTGRTPSFWAIYEDLPPETRDYVPLFTATALIISNPEAFDLDRVRPGPRYAFDYVPVDGALSVARVARLAGTDVTKVRALNPELRSDRLPPSEEPYYVRLPQGTYSTFADNYAALPPQERAKGLEHVLKPGEPVGRVAQRYHVDRGDLLDANEEAYPVSMQVGQRLTIPETSYDGNRRVAEGADEAPIRVRYGSRTVRPLADTPTDTDLTAVLSPSTASAP